MAALTDISSGGAESPHSQPEASTSGREEIKRVSFYRWGRTRHPLDRPEFLHDYPCPPDEKPNINSFLGPREVHQAKIFVPRESYAQFLDSYLDAYQQGYMLFLAEKYYHEPYRHFAELDFPWSLSMDRVRELGNRAIAIALETTRTFYHGLSPSLSLRPPEIFAEMGNAVVSMRTPYKIHLNFPQTITTESLSFKWRDLVVAKCKEELNDARPREEGELVDWESVIDFPHGSFRMLGSRKSKNMDKDPSWVSDKAYYPVVWQQETGTWSPTGIHYNVLRLTSIYAELGQIAEFEASELFREISYHDVDAYNQKLEERRRRRAGLAQEPVTEYVTDQVTVKLKIQELPDGRLKAKIGIHKGA